MTNTLHRRGTAEELHGDYVVFCLPTRSVSPELPGKLRQFTDIVRRHKPINANTLRDRALWGIEPDRIDEELEDHLCLHATYDNLEAVSAAVQDLVDADLGLPINISGPLEEVQECCQRAGITRHSVEQSLGTKGAVERLPPPHVVELNALCGHGLVGYNLIKMVIDAIRTERVSMDEGVRLLSRPCQCGVYNLTRARQILTRVRTGG